MLRKLFKRLRNTERAAIAPVTAALRQSHESLIADGRRLETEGNLAAALERYARAADVAPNDARPRVNAGIVLEALGEIERALASYEAALVADPSDPYANYNLGRLLFARGETARAEGLLRSALRRKADFGEALVMLGAVCEARGDLTGAVAALESAVARIGADFGAWFRYGEVLRRSGKLIEAESALRQALAIDPRNVDANYQLAGVLRTLGSAAEAEECLGDVLAHAPDHIDARLQLVDLLLQGGKVVPATEQLEAVLRLRPDHRDALFNYTVLLKNQRRLGEAEAALRRLFAIAPDYVRAYRIMASILLQQLKLDEALRIQASARSRHPDDLDLESIELFMLNFDENLANEALFERHKAFGARLQARYPPRSRPFTNAPDPARRLRIGYLSGDFGYHVVTLFVLPLLEHHDRARFEIFCYSTGETVDEYARRVAAGADVWRAAGSASEGELAAMIEADQIDILVDLTGHSGISSLGVFARRSAPVQCTWLGYLNTTGLTRMDYRICDGHTDPPGIAERYHTERLVRLPHSQWCYRPFIVVEPALVPPSVMTGYVTFGSFTNPAKLSRTARQLWVEILKRVPDSRLVIVGVADQAAQGRLLEWFAGAGIARSRLALRPYLSLQDYYRAFDDVDIALDTMPYSGGTTTCDTLWMGVPVVTLAGDRSTSRSATSILATVGQRELVATTSEDYVRIAAELATDAAQLPHMRHTLRERMRNSPLTDEPGFVRDLEAAYRAMWRAWCEGQRGT